MNEKRPRAVRSKIVPISSQKWGFTLIELLVAIGISLIMFAVTWVISSRSVASNESFSYTEQLVSAFRNAQFRSMFDAGTQTSSSPFGVHLEANRFVIFHGTSYVEGASENIVTIIPDNLAIQSNTLGTNVIFALSSGEIGTVGSLILYNKASEVQTTISLNALGVVQHSP